MKLAFSYVPVADLPRAIAFYRDALGLDEAWREGTDTVAYVLPGSDARLMVSTTPGQPTGPMYLVDDVSSWIAQHSGLNTVVERHDIPDGSVIGFADPDGNVFYVFDQHDD